MDSTSTGSDTAAGPPAQGNPNFVVILTDDQGYGDLSALGNAFVDTPNLDALARTGTRLTNWYANAPVCSPTRAALLTGRYPHRTGVTQILPGHRKATGLTPGLPTIASCLQRLGYRSYLAGKWHLGAAPECRPDRFGFDHWFGHLAGAIDYYSHIQYWGMNNPGPGRNPSHDLWADGMEEWHNGRYLTDLITDKAEDFIREAVGEQAPFFLEIAYNAPHYPLHAPRADVERFRNLHPDRRAYAATLFAMDRGVGRIVSVLDELHLTDNTCLIFSSDNGPSVESRNWLDGRQDPFYGSSSGGFRGGKGSLFEGGIRVPGIIRWPGHVAAGAESSTPAATMDVLPTVLAAVGEKSPSGIDGTDLLEVLGHGQDHERVLLWQYYDQTAVRRGRYKLVRNVAEPEGGPVVASALYDLETDPAERLDLASRLPTIVQELERELVMLTEPPGRGASS